MRRACGKNDLLVYPFRSDLHPSGMLACHRQKFVAVCTKYYGELQDEQIREALFNKAYKFQMFSSGEARANSTNAEKQ